jgi:hypothetical protein
MHEAAEQNLRSLFEELDTFKKESLNYLADYEKK